MIRNLCQKERPRERCLEFGPECLSLRECFAVLFGSGPKGDGCMGLARRLLLEGDSYDSLEDDFFRRVESYSDASIQGIKGLGPSSRARFLVTIEIARRYARFKQKNSHTASLNKDLLDLPKDVQDKVSDTFRYASIERVGFVPCFSDNSIGRLQIVQSGDENGVNFHRQHFLRLLLFSKAEGFWMFHNHANHCESISESDHTCTREIKTLAKIIGVQFYGHWLVAGHRFIPVVR